MKSILLTGASGFVGSHILPILQQKYDVVFPSRKEMNLKDRHSVIDYFSDKNFDAVVHLASPSPVRSPDGDSFDTLVKDCLLLFTNLQSVSGHYGKLIYSGSGAEFDKTRDIVQIAEDKIGDRIPVDDYGLVKYVLNQMARQSDNCYNLRIFGCYGPGEYDYKFIKHSINCVFDNKPITIRQDCYFDYMYVDDYAKYVEFIIENNPVYHDYNACAGIRIKLSEVAEIVKRVAGSDVPVEILNDGMNFEYTGSNKRIMDESAGKIILTDIECGIKKMLEIEGTNR